MKKAKYIGWFSGGVTSAVACKLLIDDYSKSACRMVFINTNNEHDDTMRFLRECEEWYGVRIEFISSDKFHNPREVWYHYKSLNVANGAICSSVLKRDVRLKWEKENDYISQAFGFEADKKELNRAISMKINYPNTRPLFPLLNHILSKKDCIKRLQNVGIKIPAAYRMGLNNNNCLETGCVQGGIGYWQHIQRIAPDKFDNMAQVEHELTDMKGQPVTMLKDQSPGGGLVFLKPHPDYPSVKDISMMKGRPPRPLVECNGFCGLNDLAEKQNETAKEINFDNQLSLF